MEILILRIFFCEIMYFYMLILFHAIIYIDIQGVPEFFEQNLTKCSLQLYKHIELHKGMSESV